MSLGLPGCDWILGFGFGDLRFWVCLEWVFVGLGCCCNLLLPLWVGCFVIVVCGWISLPWCFRLLL